MFKGPGKVVVPDERESFGDWQDFHREGEERHFEYNPAAGDITKQTGAFPETDDFESPEKR